MKRVLMLASWYPRHENDPTGRFILAQAKALESSCDVRLIDCSHRFSILPRSWQIALQASRILKKCRSDNWTADIIHAQVAYPAGAIALKLKQKLHIPVVLTEHTGPLDLLQPYFGSTERFYSHFQEYDQIIAVSSFLKNEILKGAPSAKVRVVGNTLTEDCFNSPLSISPTQNSVAFVGGLTEAKGVKELISALEVYDQLDGPDLELFILGDGPLKPWIEEKSRLFKKTRIHLSSGGPNEVRKLLSEVSFLLLPSRIETFSLVAAEAIALGRGVLGFECGGPADFVGNTNGLLLKNRDPNEFALKLKDFVTNPAQKLSPELCAKRRESIRTRFSAQAVAQELRATYEGLSTH